MLNTRYDIVSYGKMVKIKARLRYDGPCKAEGRARGSGTMDCQEVVKL